MLWPIRFEGLNQWNNLTNANLPGHYFDQYDVALYFCCQWSHEDHKLKLLNVRKTL